LLGWARMGVAKGRRKPLKRLPELVRPRAGREGAARNARGGLGPQFRSSGLAKADGHSCPAMVRPVFRYRL